MYCCKYCGLTFDRPTDIANHIRGKHKVITFPKRLCTICGKNVCAVDKIFQAHVKRCKEKHTPYTCKQCGRTVTIPYGSRKFCSTTCAKKFSSRKTDELKEILREKSINYLGRIFYIEKLINVIKLRITKVENKRVTRDLGSEKRRSYSICVGCNRKIRGSGKTICKACKTYKDYIDFKNGSICISARRAKHLIEKFEGHKCSICGIKNWSGKYLPMILDHINGRAHDNSYRNLRLVCSNCDSQLPTYKSKNKNSDRKKRGWYI